MGRECRSEISNWGRVSWEAGRERGGIGNSDGDLAERKADEADAAEEQFWGRRVERM